MDKLPLVVQSYAARVHQHWGRGIPRAGIERLAALAHRYGFPVGWMVNGGSARAMAEPLRRWHEEYGDGITLVIQVDDDCPGMEAYEARRSPGHPLTKPFIMYADYREMKDFIEREYELVRRALPWADISTVGIGHKSDTLIAVLEDLDFEGMWGYIWEQVGTDGMTDCGCPFNLFYASRESYKTPAQYPGRLVAGHWLSHDLTNTYYSRGTSIFTTDPNDLLRAGLCDGREIGYLKDLLKAYLANLEHNDLFIFMFHQESHEMEHSEVCRAYTPEQVENTALMIDAFFRFASAHQQVEPATFDKVVKEFKSRHRFTPPTCMLFPSIRPERRVNYYHIPEPEDKGPYRETLFYYDQRCQLVFPEGEEKPVSVRDYTKRHPTDCDTVYPEEQPEVALSTTRRREGDRIICELSLSSREACVYGVCLWGDFAGWGVKAADAEVAKIVSDRALFARMDLNPGENRFRIELEGAI